MTEKQFIHKLIEREMPDMEAVRQTCLAQGDRKENFVWNQKHSRIRKFAVTAVCIVAVLCVGSGIGYAATGETPWKLFSMLFNKCDCTVQAQISEERNAEEQVITSTKWNLQYTLECSWYDREKGILLTQMEVCTLDGSPIVSWDDIYENGDGTNEDLTECYSSATDLQSKFESGEKEAMDIYRNAIEAYFLNAALDMNDIWYGVGRKEISVNSTSSVQIYTIWYNVRNENAELYDEIIIKPSFALASDDADAQFVIRDSGRMAQRSIHISAIPGCVDAQLTGMYLALFFDSGTWDSTEESIQCMEITMNDGTVFKGISNTSEDEPGYEEALKQNIHLVGIGSMVSTDMVCVDILFDQIVNVDEIVSVKINGQECLKK